ncbi:MAG: BACON domain-containing protein, partial [candidate division Zixibacteria bacterium]|nr:BACON domain-containing protein [candidate division Zixibacteria bacterium]
MKLRFFVILSIMVLGGYGMAGAQLQSLSLDHTDGLIDADHLDTGVPVTFYIRITNDEDNNFKGITNGFRVYSPDGATWTATVPSLLTSIDWGTNFMFFFITPTNVDGIGADTVGYGGVAMGVPPSIGLPAFFDDTTYSITIGPVDQSDAGKTICLDSTFYPTSGVWKWDGGVGIGIRYPAWDGPHCFTIGPPPPCEVVVTSPAAGETWTSGTLQTITYETTNCENCDNVDISYSVDGGGWIGISTGSTNTGTFSWTVPEVESNNVVVRVCCSGTSDCGESGVFSIVVPEIVSVDPNSAAQCDEGLVVTITGANTDWYATGGSGTTNVFLTHESGSPTINASSFVVNSPTLVTATFDFAYDAPTGLYDVTVDSWSAPADVLEDGFTVNPAAPSDISVDPMTLTFDALQFGPNPDDQSFSITSVSCRHDFTVSDDADWLTLSIADGTTPADVIVSVDITGLTPSVYNAT